MVRCSPLTPALAPVRDGIRRLPAPKIEVWGEKDRTLQVRSLPMSRDITLVREGGLEPPRPYGHRNLYPARLPIPPLARVKKTRQ